jgi:tetratricopeptide (TPR) repeat protein
MASVFLSYDHDDATRAAPIAAALEKAGHSVWWDRHIAGGTEYNREIESAVERSDAVVVLWSESSVKSAWVRDEAAEGRDQQKLVPLLIDAVKPPMGFRQFQTIDLTGWRKRTGDAAFGELLRAIDGLGRPVADHRGPSQPALRPSRHIYRTLVAGLSVALLAVIAALLWRPWEPASSGPSVTVLAGDESAESRALAGNLLVQLGSLQGANADALHLVEPESGAKADLVFKVAGLSESAEPRAGLSLIDIRADTLLWSREFGQPGGNAADLRQQLAYSAGQVLRCTTDALAPDHPRLKLSTLKLYLNGCADFSHLSSQDPRSAIATFKKVTEQAPAFSSGWAKLILAEMFAYRQTDFADAALRRDLQRHIERARELDPGMADTYLAECWLQTPRPIIGWMRLADIAVSKDPNHAEALINRATGLISVGRLREAVADARRAVQAEPLYPAARGTLINHLTDSGAIEAARNELREAQRLWPGATDVLQSRFALEYRYGDPKEAMRILQSGGLGFTPTAAQKSFLEARIDPSPAKIERAIAEARGAGEAGFAAYIQTLVYFGRTDDAAEALLSADPRAVPGVIYTLFRPYSRALRHDPRFMAIAKRLELTPYWQETGKWPDFCFEPDLPYDCKKEAARLAA